MRKGWLLACGALLLAAAFFRFALLGYGVTAALLLLLAALCAAFWLLERLSRRHAGAARRLRIGLLALLILGLGCLTAAEIPVLRAARTDADPKADYVIVLGAGVNGTVPSLSLTERLEAALDYLERYPAAVAVVSGGQGPGEDITEAEAMARYLTARGIPAERILREDRAASTRENLAFSRELIARREGAAPDRVAVVTSEYHLYRSKKLASSLGMEALGVAARTRLPVLRINYFIREALATVYLWVFGA